jgi:hypothetical protein
MDRILFGDNQFFGVNHMSEEKARAQQMRFKDLQAVIDVLDAAYQEGINLHVHHARPRGGGLRSLARERRRSTPTTSSIRACPTRTSTPTP